MPLSPSLEGQLEAYLYMVTRGKPAAMLPVHKRDIEESVEYITARSGLKTHVEPLDNEWYVLWIYKCDHILPVIKAIPQVPVTVFDHWVLGKLFGYDEASIQDYLSTKTFYK